VSALARRANDVNAPAIVFVNSDSGEGYIAVDGNVGDRKNLTLWQNGDAVISAVAAESNNTIVVVHSVGPVILDDYANNPNVTAILWAGVPGQESGNAILDVLYGKVNPSAKLPFTIGANRTDYGTDILYTPNHDVPQIQYVEGGFIDYRAFDKYNVTPTYEFGFGLSYTTFEYSDLKVTAHTNVSEYTPSTSYTSKAKTYGNYTADPADHQFPEDISSNRISMYCYPWLNSTDLSKASADPSYGAEFEFPANSQNGSAQPIPRAGGAPGGNPRLYDVLYTVEATVTNTGAVAGDEVAQLYVSRGGEYEPVRELRGFERLADMQPGESRTFSVGVTRRDVSSWDTEAQDWVVRDAAKTVWVGRSSRDLPLSQALA
jgi:beta-glucosidase